MGKVATRTASTRTPSRITGTDRTTRTSSRTRVSARTPGTRVTLSKEAKADGTNTRGGVPVSSNITRRVTALARQAGFRNVLNEYIHRSRHWTGPHMHVANPRR